MCLCVVSEHLPLSLKNQGHRKVDSLQGTIAVDFSKKLTAAVFFSDAIAIKLSTCSMSDLKMKNLMIKNPKMKNCQDLMIFVVILWGKAPCGRVTFVKMSFQSKCS